MAVIPSKGLGQRVSSYSDPRQQFVAEQASGRGYKAIDSFCGPGGMSLGLEWAGFDVPLAFDLDKQSVQTHIRNLRGACIQADAKDLTGGWLLKQIRVGQGELALLAGGPPCQGFSKQKRGAHLGDDRNELVLEYTRLVEEISPRFMLFENVAIFGQARGKKYISEMAHRLKNYALTPHFYNAADYGVPQTRQRFIIVGKRLDQRCRFHIPRKTVRRWRTLSEVLADLPSPPRDRTPHPQYPNHTLGYVTEANIRRFMHVPQGGGWMDIPQNLRLPCHQNADTRSGGWPDVYGRLRWDGQCPTITGGFDSFTRGRYGHPIEHRPITAREAARIQGFPDSFVFTGNRGDVRSQIGNVVPPPLAEAIGLQILRCLLVHDGILDDDYREPFSQSEMFEVA